jgi:hypothetical protein
MTDKIPPKKNKLESRFETIEGPDSIVAKADPNNARPDRNQLPVLNKMKNGLPKSQWVHKPVSPYESMNGEIYRALGPKNGAPKTRDKVNEQGQTVAVLSKKDSDFVRVYPYSHPKALITTSEHKRHLAECLVMMYLNESRDLNSGNFDIDHGVRLDFEHDFTDLIGGLKGRCPSYFNGRPVTGYYFPVHPLDLDLFPNFLIAKIPHVLMFTRTKWDHHQILHDLNACPEFTETVYQYLLKSLLFDKALIKTLADLHTKDEIKKDDYSEYLERRYQKIKRALVQVPAFLAYINNKGNFNKLKKNIIEEFNAYNNTFKEPIINIEQIEAKLTGLSSMFKTCEQLDDNADRFLSVFTNKFNNKDPFHQYAMRMLLASGDPNFNEIKLLRLVREQAKGLRSHLYTFRDFSFENRCGTELDEFFNEEDDDEEQRLPWDQAQDLFKVEQDICAKLKAKEIQWYQVNKNIEELFIKLNDAKPKLNNAQPDVIDIHKEIDSAMLECNQPCFIRSHAESDDDIVIYNKMKTLLRESVQYGRDIKARGDDLWASAYLEKNQALMRILTNGIEERQTPFLIAAEMIKKINEPDEYLLEHKSTFEWLVRAFLNLFSKPEVSLGWLSVSTPLFTTERQKKLCKVVEVVYNFPTPSA